MDDVKSVSEGQANVYLPKSVFYNNVQEFNRDLTIAVITQHSVEHHAKLTKGSHCSTNESNDASHLESEDDGFKVQTSIDSDKKFPALVRGQIYDEGLTILEGLAASGLRSVRFALEIPGLKQVVGNDFSSDAVEMISKNRQLNKVEELVTASCNDAAILMYQHRKREDRFHVIDLDPYGTPAPFLDSAVQAVRDGGLLCVTCTDMAVLCGKAPEACHAKYGSMPLHGRYCHEMALRIVLRCIESHANCYGRYIEPLLSVSVDFYCRVFVRLHTSAKTVKDSITKLSRIYGCYGCGDFILHPIGGRQATRGEGNFKYFPSKAPSVPDTCKHCGSHYTLGGPIWSAPIHNKEFVSQVISSVSSEPGRFGTSQRIIGMLSVVVEELDNPLYYVADELFSVIHCTPCTLLQFRSAILHGGYKVSMSHAGKNSLKTDAPTSVIWDILRCWVKQHPVKESRLVSDNPARIILSQEPSFQADFTLHEDANPASRQRGLLRWQANPERDWGPKARASGEGTMSLEEKRQRGIEKAQGRRNKRKVKQEQQDGKKTRTDEEPTEEQLAT